MAKRGRKSAIQQHVEQLKALDKQFRRFDAKLRRAIRANPSLKSLEADLDRTLVQVQTNAYGLLRRRGR